MKSIHFFTEIGPNLQQAVGQNFGALSNSEYHLSSLHSWSGSQNPKVYAALSGILRYQQDGSNSDLLNAVIQVSDTVNLREVPLKYLIYRGIRKDSILQTNGKFVEGITGSHIVLSILDGSLPEISNYLSLGLGIVASSSPGVNQIDVPDDAPLERLFTNEYDKSAWSVGPGLVLGDFDKNAFGLEIVLEGIWQEPKIGIVRGINISTGHRLIVPTAGSDLDKKAIRETVLNYLDPVCLWSLFYRKGIDTDQGVRKKDDLYIDLLSLYRNKNKVYIDVRNENNFSLNFYGDYNNIGLKIGASGTSVSTLYSSNSWPIHVLDSAHIELIPNEEKTLLSLALPLGGNTLNLCFLTHAPIYKRERLELLNRWPYFAKNEARFRDIRPIEETDTQTEYIELSTYQIPDGTAPVASYFRLFYAKQKEAQAAVAGIGISALNILDNLFTVKKLSEIIAKKENYEMRSWLDGNMRYIDRASAEGVGIDAQFSGMYKTGIAIDNNSITLFAIPFAVLGRKQFPKVSLALPASNVENFLEVLAGNTKDLGIQAIDIARPGNPNIKVLNIYGKPLGNGARSNDPDGFIGFSMTQDEYAALELGLLGFDALVHPVFFQIHSQESQAVLADNQPINKVVLRMAGIDLTEEPYEIILNGANQAILYGLALNGGQYFNTDLAASFIVDPIVQNPFKITIGHNPAEESEKFKEILSALTLVKDFLGEEFNEIQAMISNGKVDLIPGFKLEGGTIVVLEPRSVLRKYSLSVGYAADLGQTTSGEASGEADYERQLIVVQNSNPTESKTSNHHILRPGNQTYPSPLPAKSIYEEKALNINNTPEAIAAEFQPTLFGPLPYLVGCLKIR